MTKVIFTAKEMNKMLSTLIHSEEKAATTLDKAIQKNSDSCLAVLADIQILSGSVELTSENFIAVYRDMLIEAGLYPLYTTDKGKIKPVAMNEAIKNNNNVAKHIKRVNNWLYNTLEKSARDTSKQEATAKQAALSAALLVGKTDAEIEEMKQAATSAVKVEKTNAMFAALVDSFGSADNAFCAFFDYCQKNEIAVTYGNVAE